MCQGEGSGDPAELGAAARIPKGCTGGKHPGLNYRWDLGPLSLRSHFGFFLGKVLVLRQQSTCSTVLTLFCSLILFKNEHFRGANLSELPRKLSSLLQRCAEMLPQPSPAQFGCNGQLHHTPPPAQNLFCAHIKQSLQV